MAHKSRINLYIPSLRPIKDKLPLNMMVSIWAVTVVIFTAAGMTTEHKLRNLSDALDSSRKALTDKQAEVAQLQEQHQGRKASPQLTEQMDQLTKELQGKRILSQHLKGQGIGQAQKYSEVMRDMAKFHSDKLWLTEMRFDELGISLRGYALNALAVPQWMAGLQQSPHFIGKEFAVMNIEDKNQQVIAFEINSVAVDMAAVETALNQVEVSTQEAQ